MMSPRIYDEVEKLKKKVGHKSLSFTREKLVVGKNWKEIQYNIARGQFSKVGLCVPSLSSLPEFLVSYKPLLLCYFSIGKTHDMLFKINICCVISLLKMTN